VGRLWKARVLIGQGKSHRCGVCVRVSPICDVWRVRLLGYYYMGARARDEGCCYILFYINTDMDSVCVHSKGARARVARKLWYACSLLLLA